MKQRVPSFNLSGANIPSFIVVVTLVCTTLTFASDKSLSNRPSHGPLMTSHGPLQGPFNAILKDIGESIKREAGKSQCLNIFQNKVIFEFISILARRELSCYSNNKGTVYNNSSSIYVVQK